MGVLSVGRKLRFLAGASAAQWLPAPLIERRQLGKLRRIVAFAATEVPFYRELYGSLDPRITARADLARLPTVTREEVVDAYPARLCHRPPAAGDHVFRTSGTSGLFMEIAYDAEAHDWLDAIYGRALFATGYRPWHRIAYFWLGEEPKPPTVYERAGLMRKHMLPLTVDPRDHLGELRRIRPRFVYSFPSVMDAVARVIEREGLRGLSVEGVICHGELLTDRARDRIRRAFRCPVWNQYGAQEFNRLAWDCAEHGALHIDADSVLIEVLDGDRPCEPGEEGELVVTGLVNRLMPLIRYRLGDLGRLVDGACPCGRGLPRLEITEGRSDDVIPLDDGRVLGPRLLSQRIESFDGMAQYRLVQRREGFELRYVPDDAPASLEDDLRDALRDLLGDIDVVRVDAIPLNRRGKLRKIVSEL